MSAETTTPPAATEKVKKPQSALQVPNFADKLAGDIAVKCDESKKHIIAAAILAFSQMDPETQVALIGQARVEYRKSA